MKPLLLLALCALADPAHADCPAPEQLARSFQQEHADFHWNPERHDPALYTPGFDAALRAPQVVHLVLKRQTPQCWRLDDFITPLGESLRRMYSTAP